MNSLKTFSVTRILTLMVVVGATIMWLQSRSAWDHQGVRSGLTSRKKLDGSGHELYMVEFTVYEDESGREIPPPMFSRQMGWIWLAILVTFGAFSLRIGKWYDLRLPRELGIAAVATVSTILSIEVIMLGIQVWRLWFDPYSWY